MRKIKAILIIAVLGFAALAGWRVGYSEVANLELQEDLHDMANQSSFRFGNVASTRSDDDYREAVVRKASEYDITLKPSQVTVRRPDTGTTLYLAADYSVPVNLPRYSFVLHFSPASDKKAF